MKKRILAISLTVSLILSAAAAFAATSTTPVTAPGGGPGAGRTGPGYRIDRHAKYDNQAYEYGARLSDA